jgi:tetratricopeptide (TPR) repeat protein
MRAVYAVILAVVCLEPVLADTPQELNSRGVEFFRQGKYAESEKAYREALESYKSAPIRDVNGYAATLNNLAGTLQTDGKVAEAKVLLTEVVSLDSQIKGEDDIVTHALNNLALLHQAQGEYPKTIGLLQRALERSSVVSATRAGTLHNLAAAYLDLGQTKKAGELFEASLRMNSQVGAVRETPPTLAFLALLAARAKDTDRAFILLDRALRLRREIYGPTHPLVALSLNDIAELYTETKRYDDAAAVFEESLAIFKASVGVDHAYAAPVLFHYGESRRRQGRNEEALELFQRAIRIMETTFGPGHLRLGLVYRSAALAAEKLRLKEDAKNYTARADVLQKGQIPYARHTIDVSSFTTRK